MTQQAAAVAVEDQLLGTPYELFTLYMPVSERELYLGPSGQVCICDDDDDLVVVGFGNIVPVRVDFDAECAMVDDLIENLLPLFEKYREVWKSVANSLGRHGVEKLRARLTGEEIDAPEVDMSDFEESNEEVETAVIAFLDRWEEHVHPMI